MDPEIRRIDPPRHVALISKTGAVPAADVAFMAAALAVQLRDHVCPAWGLPAIELAAYQDGAPLPPSLAAVLYLVDNDGNPASLGYHASLAGLVYGFVDVRQTRGGHGSVSAVASHEAIELVLNKNLDRWIWIPSRRLFFWREACDPVQELTYQIEVELAGVKRSITVSDFILPEFFDADHDGPGDHVGLIRPLAISPDGYQVAKTDDGRIVTLPEDSPTAAAHIAGKRARELSRLSRRAA